jgi:hypothetical protein
MSRRGPLCSRRMIKYPLAQDTIDKHDINRLIAWLKTYPRLTQGEVNRAFEKKWNGGLKHYGGASYSSLGEMTQALG